MKKARFTESQIISILSQQEKGITVTDICRENGISNATFFNWKAKYGWNVSQSVKKVKGAGNRECTAKENVCRFKFVA